MLYEFIELPAFSALRESLFCDEDYGKFQAHLCEFPEAGAVIPGTDGCRKIRWAAQGKGKRGGSRVVYFLRIRAGKIVLITAYGKNERDDVPRSWLRKIKQEYDNESSENFT